MMLRYMGWTEAADLVAKGMDGAIGARTVTYDFARLMEGAKEVKCSEFGDAVIAHMQQAVRGTEAPRSGRPTRLHPVVARRHTAEHADGCAPPRCDPA